MRFARAKNTTRAVMMVVLAWSLALAAFPQKKKSETTQVLQLPKDLPAMVEGDTRRLAFHVTTLSNKGLLSRQVRDALGELNRLAKGDPILKIRAFVAGSGDARRVRDLVSEVFTEHKQPLPVLSLVQAGGLPLEGAQVVLEGISVAKKDVNPLGLGFLSARTETADDPLSPVTPLVAKSVAALRVAARAAGSASSDVVQVSCFLSSLQDLTSARKLLEAEYGGAAIDFVQTQRSPIHALASCEAVARLRRDPGQRLRVIDPEGLSREAGASQVAMVGATRVVLTGTQVSFGYEEKDARLAFQRIEKALEQSGASAHDVAMADFYALGTAITDQVRKVRNDFFDGAHPPASTMLLFEGLPSMNAGFAMDVVAVK